MKETINNTEIKVSIPEGMHLMDTEERRSVFGKTGLDIGNTWGIINKENHLLIFVGWQKRPLLLGRAASLEKHRDASEKKVMEALEKASPKFENLGHLETEAGGKKLSGFSVHYQIKSPETGEYVMQYVKDYIALTGKYIYTVQFIYREGFREYGEAKIREFLDSMEF